MEPAHDGHRWDPSEEFVHPSPDNAQAGQRTDGWVVAQTLGEILMLEFKLQSVETCCPRCGAWIFTYGRLQFCSNTCQENLCLGEPTR